MISTEAALARIFALLPPVEGERIALAEAAGRVLTAPVTAPRDEPPFAASSMDGYALKGIEADPEAMFRVIGEAAAGRPFEGRVGAGECVRIFTGAPVPEGADRVIMQEQATRRGDLVTLARQLDPRPFIRPPGADFRAGQDLIPPRPLRPADLALLAAMNMAEISVARRPEVAILATGDELVMPGEPPGPGQIVASNPFALKAIVAQAGGQPRILPIARDTAASLRQAFGHAQGARLILTTGGAAVGAYDLVADVARELGGRVETLRVAMRPGKRLIVGRLGDAVLLGLPGTPTAAMVAARVHAVPAIRALLGLGQAPAPRLSARLSTDLPENGPLEGYLPARLDAAGIAPIHGAHGLLACASANALLIRPPGDPARAAGDPVPYLPG